MSNIPRIPVDGVIVGTGPGKGVHKDHVVGNHDDVIRAILRGMRHQDVPIIPDNKPGTRYGIISDSSFVDSSVFDSEDVFTSESDTMHVPLFDGFKNIGFITPKSLGKIWSLSIVNPNFNQDWIDFFTVRRVTFNDSQYYLISSGIHSSIIADRDVIIGQGDLSLKNIN